MRRTLIIAVLLAGCANAPPQGDTPYTPTPGMRAILEEYQALRPQPLPSLPIDRARMHPTLTDAARAIPNTHGLPAPSVDVPQVTELRAAGATGPLSARLYRPTLARNTPVIIAFPGGTWVTPSLDAFDETARQLSARTGFVVVAIQPRAAPEAPFPAAHDDARAAYRWALLHLREWGADPTRVVLAGEGPGATLAMATAQFALGEGTRDPAFPPPDHILLITPQVTTRLDGVSMDDSGRSQPLTRRIVRWAQDEATADNRDLADPRMNPGAGPLAGLPPTTIVLAQIDPLRSQGEELAVALTAARVPTTVRTQPGVTHGFFGLGAALPDAAAAEDWVAARLRAAFGS